MAAPSPTLQPLQQAKLVLLGEMVSHHTCSASAFIPHYCASEQLSCCADVQPWGFNNRRQF